MKNNQHPTTQSRIKGALLGVVVGDALGVPVEFVFRETLDRDPVTTMIGYGTHSQPAGTWSDDTSMTLCTLESLVEKQGVDLSDIANRFVRWHKQGYWTPHGHVFDIGIQTSKALYAISKGISVNKAGSKDEYSNGNGSLMRIMPVALYCAQNQPDMGKAFETIRSVSAITHAHPRSTLACIIYFLLVKELLVAESVDRAFTGLVDAFTANLHNLLKEEIEQVEHFGRILDGSLPEKKRDRIKSDGYVVHTLEAAIWCLINNEGFEDTVLAAVNMGGDSDTTGAVVGGLAGVFYGAEGIPSEWKDVLARKKDVVGLVERFVEGG